MRPADTPDRLPADPRASASGAPDGGHVSAVPRAPRVIDLPPAVAPSNPTDTPQPTDPQHPMHPSGPPEPRYPVDTVRPADGIELRPATEADLLDAARLRARSWQESFAGFLPAASLEGFADSPWTRVLVEEWRQLITAGGVVWLAFQEGELVGLAQAERDDAPDAPAPVKLSKLYVLQKAKGTGLGARLFECAVGSGAAYLWVLEDNAHARAFYERRGFRADGTAQHLFDDLAHVREIRMVRERGDRSRARQAERASASAGASPATGATGEAGAADNSVETAGAVVEDGRHAQPA